MAPELDLNTRERTRYANMLNSLSEDASKAAEALCNMDDLEFLVNFLLISLSGPNITKELKPIIEEALEAANLKKDIEREA